MKHTASKRFWQCFDALPVEVQALARKNFDLLKADSSHSSLHFKQLGGGRLCSVRIGLYYRAPGLPSPETVHRFWIGAHGEYDKIVG